MNRSVSTESSVSLRLWLLLGLIVPLLSMLPFLYLQGLSLVSQPGLLYFPFSIALGVWLLVRGCDYRPASLPRARFAVFLVWCGVGLSVFGIYLYSPWIVQVAAVVVVFAWSLGAFGGTRWTRVFAISSLFAISVPLPMRLDMPINFWLQSVASSACSGFLDAISVPNIVEGSVLQIADKRVQVSEVCGGADSIYAFMAIGLAVLVLRRSSLITGLMTLASIPFFSVIGNCVRLLLIALGIEELDSSFTTGLGYVAVSITTFGVSVVGMLLWHVFVVAIFEPITEDSAQNKLTMFYQWVTAWPQANQELLPADRVEGASFGQRSPATKWRPSFATMGLPGIVCLLVGTISAYAVFFTANDFVFAGISEEKAAAFPSQEAFPDQFGSLRRISFIPITQTATKPHGRYSHLWKFDDHGNQVFASLDFPFPGWHPVWTVYQSSGWKIMETKPVEIVSESGNSSTAEEFKMQNQYGLFGFVWYAFFDENGVVVERPSELEQSARVSILARLQSHHRLELPTSYRVQVLFESGRELNQFEIERNRKLFFEIFERIRQQSLSALKKAK